MFKTIRTLGITSDVAYTLGFLSVIGSIFIWYSHRHLRGVVGSDLLRNRQRNCCPQGRRVGIS